MLAWWQSASVVSFAASQVRKPAAVLIFSRAWAAVSDHQEPEIETDEQQQAAAAAVKGLPADSKEALVGSVIQGLGADQQKQVAAAAVSKLS